MIDLSGRRALVTGGARGLGRAIAEMLQDAGAAIAVVDQEAVLKTADLPLAWYQLALDLTGSDAEPALADFIARRDGLDILVANAGRVPLWRRVAALDMAEWDAVFALNVRAIAASLKAATPALKASDCGAAVLMASINGYRAHPDQTLYTSSKHAVLGLMRAAALDLGRDGVRVNALAPGPILTKALRARIAARAAAGGPPAETVIAAMQAETALGRVATENDVAKAACFLASDIASGITGVCLPVEAGLA